MVDTGQQKPTTLEAALGTEVREADDFETQVDFKIEIVFLHTVGNEQVSACLSIIRHIHLFQAALQKGLGEITSWLLSVNAQALPDCR